MVNGAGAVLAGGGGLFPDMTGGDGDVGVVAGADVAGVGVGSPDSPAVGALKILAFNRPGATYLWATYKHITTAKHQNVAIP